MDNYKSRDQKKPIEQHNTAAWAEEEKKKDISKVTIPSDVQVLNAKEYVDTNQK